MGNPNYTPDTIEIALTKGQVAVVSNEDADLAKVSWYVLFAPNYAGGGRYLAVRCIRRTGGRTRRVLMHRIILARMLGRPLTRRDMVDHADGNPLNNQRSNLRLASWAENGFNRSRQANGTSGYKGVTWFKRRQKWQALIQCRGKRHFLGYYDTAEEAAHAYDAAARELHGEFARFNFPLDESA